MSNSFSRFHSNIQQPCFRKCGNMKAQDSKARTEFLLKVPLKIQESNQHEGMGPPPKLTLWDQQ